MKIVSDHFATSFSPLGNPSDGAFDNALLDRIGDDLRHLYDEMTDSELPRSLRDLAETIDARRMDAARSE